MSPRLTAAVVGAAVSLLAVVILVGLAQKSLDTTGIALGLITLISGVSLGIGGRLRGPGGPGNRDDDDRGGDGS